MVKALQIDSYIDAFINGDHADCHVGFKMMRSFLYLRHLKPDIMVHIMTGNQHFMTESELSRPAKFLTVVVIIGAAIAAVFNIYQGNVRNPYAFWIVVAGFALFAIAKIGVILHKKRISFGPSLMTENMRNIYRPGYWLMIVGIIFTFAGD